MMRQVVRGRGKRQDGQEARDGKPNPGDVRNQAYSSFVGNR